MTIIGRPDLPPNTLAELVTYIKANGDKMTFGNAGLAPLRISAACCS